MPMIPRPRMVLLDRDGVLNEECEGYVQSPAQLILIPGAAQAVARLNAAGITAVVVTNQGCIGRGLIDTKKLDAIHARLDAALAESGGHLDGLYYCPDHPDQPTDRRKPAPGMLREALDHFNIAPEDVVMIGDNLRDLEAANALNISAILVKTGHGESVLAKGLPPHIIPCAIHDDLASATDFILEGNP